MKSPQEKLEEFLTSKSMKMTHERETILNHITTIQGHFDSEMVYESLKKLNIRVSRDTVFRNIPLLLEAGIIQKSVGEGKGDYFEYIPSPKAHHDHMVCLRCASVIEFFSPQLEKIQGEICSKHKFHLSYHDHRLFGYCDSCT